MLKPVVRFFDKFEDRIRIKLSHYPIIYALIGAVGIILVWKGIWETAEYFPILFGPVSILLGVLILLATGLLVSFFIGDSIIISGFKRGKKIVEKTEEEIKKEEGKMDAIISELHEIEHDLETLKKNDVPKTSL
ncbi:MAG: hypothetical protein WAV21_00300 [Minisyncoccia bacterium]